MKNLLIKFCLLLIIFSSKAVAQEWVNVSPFSDEYVGIKGCFISADKGWIWQTSTNLAHTIYYTNDGAQTFEPIYRLEDTTKYFLFLQFVDSLHGWATRGDNVLLRTLDGGYNWEDITDTSIMGDYYHSVQATSAFYFVNTEIGFCSGIDIVTQECIIYKTIDSGLSWYETNIKDSEWIYVNKFYFIDSIYGWAACSYEIDAGMSLNTVDGGETWDIVIEPGPPDVFDIYFINPLVGGAVGRNAFYSFVYITDDNFNTITHFFEAWDLEMHQYAEAIYFQNDSTIWVTGEPAIIYRSTNNGANFEVFQIIDIPYLSLYDIQFFENTGYIFGSKNNLLKFTDTISDAINEKHITTKYNSISIFPNPSANTINLEYNLSEPNEIEITIYSINGLEIYNKEIGKQNYGFHKSCLNIEGLNPGVYILNIKGQFYKKSQKLTILK